tara:strand:+ start:5637 stop:5819 length:183 start_codon:yes stop_codon:yes gene_type:complete
MNTREEKLEQILTDLLINIREDVPVNIMSKHLKSAMLDGQEELAKVGKQIFLYEMEDYNT